MEKKEKKMAVCVVTYNQAQYIRECVESVLAQEGDFGIDIFVGNDASTDNTKAVLADIEAKVMAANAARVAQGGEGTAEAAAEAVDVVAAEAVACAYTHTHTHTRRLAVDEEKWKGNLQLSNREKELRQLGEGNGREGIVCEEGIGGGEGCMEEQDCGRRRIFVYNREKNMGLVGNTVDIFRKIIAQGYTYVALLDGDDYWCDKQKLSKQVAILDRHENVSFCYMDATTSPEIAKKEKPAAPKVEIKEMFSKIRTTGIGNGTVVHRVEMLKNVPFEKIEKENLLSMDYATNVFMARQGEVAYIDSVALYWRRDGNTVSSPSTKQKALRYIDHEVRQGLFLAREFPHTAYDFSSEEAEAFRQWQIYGYAYAKKDYEMLREAMAHPAFPHEAMEGRAERAFVEKRWLFMAYVYGLRKVYTAYRMVKKKWGRFLK